MHGGHRRTEPDRVALGVDHNTLVLAPFRVLGHTDIRPCRAPGLGQLVGVLDKQIGDASWDSGIDLRRESEMDLDTVERGVAVPPRAYSRVSNPSRL